MSRLIGVLDAIVLYGITPPTSSSRSPFLPIDQHRRDEVNVWLSFYAMVVSNPHYAERGRV